MTATRAPSSSVNFARAPTAAATTRRWSRILPVLSGASVQARARSRNSTCRKRFACALPTAIDSTSRIVHANASSDELVRARTIRHRTETRSKDTAAKTARRTANVAGWYDSVRRKPYGP
jgi:hypothetical protein